jgi:hypothetical protein
MEEQMRNTMRFILMRVAALLALGGVALAAAGTQPAVTVWAAPAPQVTLVPIPFVDGQAIPAYTPRPDLVVESVSFDRGAYSVGLSWSASVTVRNIGDSAAASLSVAGHLCRYLQVGTSLACAADEIDLGQGTSLQPDETIDLAGGPFSFDSLPLDESPQYASEGITGLPDGGNVFLQVEVISGPGITEHDDGNNLALASAVYPSAPDDAAYDPAQDVDGDGWMYPTDCNDANPEVNPWHNEVLGDGIDNDCSGGDVPPLPACPTVDELYHTSNDLPCDRPPGVPAAGVAGVDADGDGSSSEEDCDDSNSAIRPGGGEWSDGVDNNCNGLVDEGFVVPDWTFADFQLARGFVNPAYLVGDYGNASPYAMPALRYTFRIENQGDSLGEGEQGLIDDLVLIRDLEGRIFATGNGGFIPYTAFDYGGGFVPACDPIGLLAVIPGGGIFGETNAANNVASGNTPAQVPSANLITEGPFDRDLRFATAPDMSPNSVFHHSEAVGTCPPLMDNVTDQNLPNAYLIGYRIYVEGELVADSVWNDTYFYSPGLGDILSAGDRVCLEIQLDPNNYVYEVDEGNNFYAQILRYRNPIFGEPHFDVVDAYSDGPASCATGTIVAGIGVAGTSSTLSSGGPSLVLGALGGALFLGSVGAALGLYRVGRGVGAASRALTVSSGLLIGGLAGGVAGAVFMAQLAPRPWAVQPGAAFPSMVQESESCDTYLDAVVFAPAEGASLKPGQGLAIEIKPSETLGRKAVDRFVLFIQNPIGRELDLPMVTPLNDVAGSRLDLVASVLGLADSDFFLPGEYRWNIALGQRMTGDELAPYAIACRGSTGHTFFIAQGAATPQPGISDTPTPTATSTVTVTASRVVITPLPPTRTPTSTQPAPDTTGPSIRSVSDSPDPIKVTQPKGCTPTTSTVSASITDPSGVASATVLFFHTTIGQVPMTHAGGNTWTTTLGPYSGTGDGTVDYQIRATDGQGNSSDSSFGQITVLACLP